ncbi:hypothetical protein PAXINDRAFT_18886 [Paxillus involutus ATCC 200175]|uniref:Uncharacterized protein n=1 Tax=Paxillus involutus ATCC 200175 TaxID=664439 RepID=A0A0C9SXX1_PAXIN|nr:hypothetical protein PAXINDRAFT_18886 [Paxillus involutus ATCC 200175]
MDPPTPDPKDWPDRPRIFVPDATPTIWDATAATWPQQYGAWPGNTILGWSIPPAPHPSLGGSSPDLGPQASDARESLGTEPIPERP